jgi:hypothetical protein
MSDDVSSDVQETELVQRPGRRPYDPNEIRMPLHEEPKLPPPTYRSIQQAINIGPDRTADPNRLEAYIHRLKSKEGFLEIPINDIYSVPRGARVAYLTTDYKWRSGGFLVDVKNSNTLYGTDARLSEYKIYFAYRAFSRALFHVQEDDVARLFVKARKAPKATAAKVLEKVILPRPRDRTRFPITAMDRKGSVVIIKYFKDDAARKRFLSSQKYDKIMSNGFLFEDEVPGGTGKNKFGSVSGGDTDDGISEDGSSVTSSVTSLGHGSGIIRTINLRDRAIHLRDDDSDTITDTMTDFSDSSSIFEDYGIEDDIGDFGLGEYGLEYGLETISEASEEESD